MVSHNNVLPNVHLRKWWQRFVKVKFAQNIRKVKRRLLRNDRRRRNRGTPIEKLRPYVQCQTQRYNFRTRLGKGFSLEELKGAGLNPTAARSIGIYVDPRRKNRCEESLKRNIERLQKYKSCLVMIPLKGYKNLKKGIGGIPADATKEEVVKAKQMKQVREIFKLEKDTTPVFETIDVSKIQKEGSAYRTLRKARKAERRLSRKQHKRDLKKKGKD